MATCGEYELERAIGWGRRSTFFSARAINDRGPALIVIRRARSVERNHRHAFLCAAAEQQTAVGAGCRRLAPILAFDCDETGFAFYATARFETSLAEFLEAECKTDGALLRDVVTSVLGVLAELQEKSRRAHGNLTPGNILLDPQGRVFLTDLAPSARDAATADDLFALGTLIYQLVRRTTRIGTLNPPLDYSPAWTEALGDDAEGWLAFTNRLLDKPRNATPDAIQSALGDLKSLAGLAAKAAKAAAIVSPLEGGATTVQAAVRRPPPKRRSPLPAILAALLLLGGGGGGFYFHKKQQAEKERLRRIAEELQRQRDVQKLLPGAIKNLAEELKQLPPDKFADGTVRSLLIRIGKSLGNSTTPDGATSEVNSLIQNWDLPDKMKAQAAAWRGVPLGWTRLADELKDAAEVDARSDTPIVAQFEKAIAARGAAADLDIEWEEITRTLGDHRAAGNRLLPDFTPWAEHEVRDAKDLKEASDHAQAALKTLRKVTAFQRGAGVRVLWDRLEREVPDIVRMPGGDLRPGWPAQWMSEASQRVAADAATREAWDAKLAEIEKRIGRLNVKDKKLPVWKNELAALRAAAAGALETDVAGINQQLLEKFKTLELPAETAHKDYSAFLGKWKAKVEAISPADPDAKKILAPAAINEFSQETAKILRAFPEYKTSLGNSAQMASEMATLLATPDKINPIFTTPDGAPDPNSPWKAAPQKYPDANAAFYVFMKDGKVATQMHFLALDKDYAMAAWETPLVLARLSGVKAASLPLVKGRQTNGPQTRTDDFTAADDWLWKSPSDLQAAAERTGKGPRDYYAAGVHGGTNNDYNPVTWLTFDEADKMARALGGQLPTAEQWKTAYGRKMAGPERRLRSDGAWSRQYPLLKGWAAETGDALLVGSATPDYGSFSRQLKQFEGDKGSAGGAPNDNNLWLTQVTNSNDWTPAKGFTNLVGNAAEWVRDGDRPAVIGASVVSPKLPVDTAFPMASTAAYFDVTFRLVVKLGEGGAGVGLQKFKEFAANIKLPDNPAAR